MLRSAPAYNHLLAAELGAAVTHRLRLRRDQARPTRALTSHTCQQVAIGITHMSTGADSLTHVSTSGDLAHVSTSGDIAHVSTTTWHRYSQGTAHFVFHFEHNVDQTATVYMSEAAQVINSLRSRVNQHGSWMEGRISKQ